jgi:hypothetical protein
MQTITPLNLAVMNSIIEAEWLRDAINIVTDCQTVPNSTTIGDLYFYNYTIRG